MFRQVNVDLRGRKEDYLETLTTEGLEGPGVLSEWDIVSSVWKDQPRNDHLQVFVQLPSLGKQKLLQSR